MTLRQCPYSCGGQLIWEWATVTHGDAEGKVWRCILCGRAPEPTRAPTPDEYRNAAQQTKKHGPSKWKRILRWEHEFPQGRVRLEYHVLPGYRTAQVVRVQAWPLAWAHTNTAAHHAVEHAFKADNGKRLYGMPDALALWAEDIYNREAVALHNRSVNKPKRYGKG